MKITYFSIMMNKFGFFGLIASCVLLSVSLLTSCRTEVKDAVRNELTPSRVQDTRLLGRSGSMADAVISARAYSQWARGAMYDEAEHAFATHEDDRINGWQNEYWGKTMLCFSGAVAYTGDGELKEWVLDKAHKFINDYQTPNGYLSTYSDENRLGEEGQWVFNIWGRKYTFWALIDLYESTGDKACLDAAVRMADHLIAQLDRLGVELNQTGSWFGISSSSILRPMNELYRLTGDGKYLDFSTRIVRNLDAKPSNEGTLLANAFREDPIYSWAPNQTYWAKAYETMSCWEGMVDFYRLTGDTHVLEGALAFYNHLVAEELNPLRSAGYFDHFLYASKRVNGMTELCDVVHWIRLNRELLLLTGESQYADRIEEAYYNAFLAGVRRDGSWGAHVIRSHGTNHLWAPSQTGMTEHQCCPDNMMRTFFDIAGSYAAESADGTLSVIFYSDASVRLKDADIDIRGGYPWNDGRVSIVIDSGKAGKVRFRAPYWSEEIIINGNAVRSAGGWCELSLPKGKSTWSLSFDMTPRLLDVADDLKDIEEYTVNFFENFCGSTPNQSGLARRCPGTEIMMGPLLLAKGRMAGTSREETLSSDSVYGKTRSASVRPVINNCGNSSVWSSWMLTLTDGTGTKEIPVADYASTSNVDDNDNWFSIWF